MMEHLTDRTVERVLAGEGEAIPVEHLRHCSPCMTWFKRSMIQERRLKTMLYRITCPPAQALFEHVAGYAPSPAIARHLDPGGDDCGLCQEEIAFYREWERFPLKAHLFPSLIGRLRVITARLRPQPGRLPTLRGESQPVTVYEAENVVLMVDQQPCLKVAGRKALHGTVLMLEEAAQKLEDGRVELMQENERIAESSLTPFGNFVLEGIAVGIYRLTLRLPSICIVVERLQIT